MSVIGLTQDQHYCLNGQSASIALMNHYHLTFNMWAPIGSQHFLMPGHQTLPSHSDAQCDQCDKTFLTTWE